MRAWAHVSCVLREWQMSFGVNALGGEALRRRQTLRHAQQAVTDASSHNSSSRIATVMNDQNVQPYHDDQKCPALSR